MQMLKDTHRESPNIVKIIANFSLRLRGNNIISQRD